MKKSNRTMLIVLLVLLLLISLGYLGCERGIGGVTGHVIDIKNPEATDNSPFEPEDNILLNGSSGSDDEDSDDGYEYWVPADPEPQDETPEKCTEDSCGDGQICYERKCVEVTCAEDSDCKDNDPCTPEICYYAGHPNSYCAEPITDKKNNDGCCPPGAWVDSDSDCLPVCGNHKCELGETTGSCVEDCPIKRHGDAPSGGGEQGGDDGPVYT